MARGLDELLERIRPAGTPGAAETSERDRASDRRVSEISEILAAVEEFEREVEERLAAARADAERIVADGRRRAREIAETCADCVAAAEADTSHEILDDLPETAGRLEDRADREITEMRDRARRRTPELVQNALELVWATVPTHPREGDR